MNECCATRREEQATRDVTPTAAAKELAPAPEGTERMQARPVFSPPVDIREDEKKITLLADLPGVAPEDVDITLEKRRLILRAKTRIEPPAGLSPVAIEYEYGDFERSFVVSEDVDPDGISATTRDGVLTVTLAKRTPTTRRIAISAG